MYSIRTYEASSPGSRERASYTSVLIYEEVKLLSYFFLSCRNNHTFVTGFCMTGLGADRGRGKNHSLDEETSYSAVSRLFVLQYCSDNA